MSEHPPKGPFTVWVDHGLEGWSYTDYENLRDAVLHESYGSQRHISMPVDFEIVIVPKSLAHDARGEEAAPDQSSAGTQPSSADDEVPLEQSQPDTN